MFPRPSLSLTPPYVPSVRPCVCAGVVCKEYSIMIVHHFAGFIYNVYILVDLVKHGVLTLLVRYSTIKMTAVFILTLGVLSVFNNLFYKRCTCFVSHLTSSLLVS